LRRSTQATRRGGTQDVDGDGNPGFTLRIRGIVNGEIYLAIREWTAFQGSTPISNTTGGIEGRLHWSTDSVVLGTDNPLLTGQPDAFVHPDANKSWFRMVRLGEDATCELLRGQGSALLSESGPGSPG
jgi:hypothetical protein